MARDVLQAWADGRIGWSEVMWWSEDGGFAAFAAAARDAGLVWASPLPDPFNGDGAVELRGPDYEADFAAWADQQTNLLLRHLAGDPHAARGIDWANVADEISSVARTLVDNGETHLARALAYVAKLAVEPDHPAACHWSMAAQEHFDNASQWLDTPELRALVKLSAA